MCRQTGLRRLLVMACKAASEIGERLSAQRRRKREATEQPQKYKGKFRRMSKVKEQTDATTLSLSQHPGCLSVGRSLAPRCSGLLVGSCCSGWGSELFALKHMNIDFTSVFNCDTCSHARTVHQSAHGASQKTYGNVWSDDFMASPTVQLFVAGFPCQPFSKDAAGPGTSCSDGRIVSRILQWIASHLPEMFVLENVPALVHRHRDCFYDIMKTLVDLSSYELSWSIVNCADHGLPHRRQRLFIVGIRRSHLQEAIQWPKKTASWQQAMFFDDQFHSFQGLVRMCEAL